MDQQRSKGIPAERRDRADPRGLGSMRSAPDSSSLCSSINPRAPSARALQRRYSEATLASDYSHTMDSMLKKNFVEWLLTRREKKSDNIIEEYKREAEPQAPAASGQRLDLGTQEAKDFFDWLLKGKKIQSFPSLEGPEALKEFLTWLMSSDLCRPMSV